MGDTFTDSWEDLVPKRWTGLCGVWEYTGVTNTKYSGNKYEFFLEDHDFCYIYIWSLNNKRLELIGQIYFQQGPLTIHLNSFTGELNKETNEWTPKLEWKSLTDLLKVLDKKFKEILETVPSLISKLEDNKQWEGI